MRKNYIKTVILYTFGVLAWFIIISMLKHSCIVNIPFIIDGLWTKEINEYFVENLTGSIAFKADQYGCDNTYIQIANHYLDGMSGEYESKPLNSIIDISSFKELESDTISITYGDIDHTYVLYKTSDGVYMNIFNKNNE